MNQYWRTVLALCATISLTGCPETGSSGGEDMGGAIGGTGGMVDGGGGGGGTGGVVADAGITPDQGESDAAVVVDGGVEDDAAIEADGGVEDDAAVAEDMGGCEAQPETCNGIDDDCDGEIDNGFAGLGDGCSEGLGLCAAEGTIVCSGDGTETQCDAIPGDASPEICDGIDNDCSGEIDDVPGVGEACDNGEGACGAQGTVICTPEGPQCDANPGEPGPEVCDGTDNDCNGLIDDIVPAPCNAGIGACMGAGFQVCGPEGLACDAMMIAPAMERCDGVDNDCNGEVDDVAGLGEACEAGLDDLGGNTDRLRRAAGAETKARQRVAP